VRSRKDIEPAVRNYPSRSSREPRHCSTNAVEGNSRFDLHTSTFCAVLPCFAFCVVTITVIPKQTTVPNIAVYKTLILLLHILKVKGYRFVVQKPHYKPRRSIREVTGYCVGINIDGCIREGSKNPWRYIALAAKFCTFAPNMCGPIVW
jgi:hypothetical protein